MRARIRAGLLAGVLAVGGCSAAASPEPVATSSPSQAGLLSGALLQYRRDVPAHRLQVRLTAAEPDLVVDAVTLLAPGLPAAAAPSGAALTAGAPLDFPVVLGAADCTVPPGAPVARVDLHDAAGSRSVEVPLDDDGLVRRLHESDCADQALRAQAEIALTDVFPTADGRALDATVTLRRLAGDDPVRVTGTRVNTVYDVRTTSRLPTLRSAGTATVHLGLTPVRCDAHALGESYRTGILTLVLALGDAGPRPFDVVPPDDLRARIEAFAVEACRAAGPD